MYSAPFTQLKIRDYDIMNTFLIHIANRPSAANEILFSLSPHIFHLRYCKQLCKLCELFVILNSCCLFCILYIRDVL